MPIALACLRVALMNSLGGVGSEGPVVRTMEIDACKKARHASLGSLRGKKVRKRVGGESNKSACWEGSRAGGEAAIFFFFREAAFDFEHTFSLD